MMMLLNHLLLIGLLSILIGAVIGFAVSYCRLKNIFRLICLSVSRMRVKHHKKKREDQTLNNTAHHHTRQGQIDARTLEAAGLFYSMIQNDFGDNIESLYLFGSRARGDFTPDSDVDLGVVFNKNMKIGIRVHWKMILSSFHLLLTYGLYFQVRLLHEGQTSQNNIYLNSINREGILIQPQEDVSIRCHASPSRNRPLW